MGLFQRKKAKDLSQGGIKGTALVQDWESESFSDRHTVTSRGGGDPIHLTDFGFGNFEFRMQLDVTLDDHRPVSGRGPIQDPSLGRARPRRRHDAPGVRRPE